MKSVLHLVAFVMISSLASSPLSAQVYRYYSGPGTSPGIVAPDSSIAGKPGVYQLIPTYSLGIWQKNPNAKTLHYFGRPGLPVQPRVNAWQFAEPDGSMKPDDAAALDPGILYNPLESHQPTGIVIKPLREIDPVMTHDPGPATRAWPDIPLPLQRKP